MRNLDLKVETSNKGVFRHGRGWGLRNYETAERVGSEMMDYFRESKADLLVTECPSLGSKSRGPRGGNPSTLSKS
jgi:glycerol-3-phosphate dehydrogenase subunit C